jgi:hypothetical protein
MQILVRLQALIATPALWERPLPMRQVVLQIQMPQVELPLLKVAQEVAQALGILQHPRPEVLWVTLARAAGLRPHLTARAIAVITQEHHR